MQPDLEHVLSHFAIRGRFLEAVPHGNGHVHDTYCASYSRDGETRRFITQRLNQHVFSRIDELMDNVKTVTRCIRRHLDDDPEAQPDRQALHLVPVKDGSPAWQDEAGDWWRVYFFVEKATTFEVCTSPEQAFEAARTFGRFMALLSDLAPGDLHETIPFFHHAPRRLQALEAAVARSDDDRRRAAQAEIDFAFENHLLARELQTLLQQGELPLRVTHNDTKLNNILFDARSHRGLCVIDLDTCMAGSALYDFGDMMRTMTSHAAEDEPDTSLVFMDLERFKPLVEGYLEGTGELLTGREIENLPLSGLVMTHMIGNRFLTDFLEGDHYFKTHRPQHNLDRCRAQYALVRSMQAQLGAMRDVVEHLRA